LKKKGWSKKKRGEKSGVNRDGESCTVGVLNLRENILALTWGVVMDKRRGGKKSWKKRLGRTAIFDL